MIWQSLENEMKEKIEECEHEWENQKIQPIRDVIVQICKKCKIKRKKGLRYKSKIKNTQE